jgi:serine kinase of HPr protein (carbohydrate metabolism regulator)
MPVSITRPASPSIHASAMLAGARAVLIRGPAGSGKSRLAHGLIEAARDGRLSFARLVGDDRVHLEAAHGRLLVRPAPALAGLIELRGRGLCRLPYEPVAAVGLVVDLDASDAERMPAEEAETALIEGILLPRLAVAPGIDPLNLVLTHLASAVRGPGECGEMPARPGLVGKK